MNKNILKRTGVIFFLITTSAMQIASGQQKNNPKIDNLNTESFSLRAKVTIYYAHEKIYSKKLKKWVYNSDKDTDAGKTASLVDIKTAEAMGLVVLAVNPAIFPYGTVGEFTDNDGNRKVGVGLDTGKDVISAKASGGKVPVIDIYTPKYITGKYHNFKITKYTGPNFKRKLNDAQRLQHLQRIKDTFVTTNHLAKR